MNAAIVGAHHTRVGELAGSTCMGLHAQAAFGAVYDAGLGLSDIDAVLCAYSLAEPHLMLASVFCEFMGIRPGYSAAIQVGGASACVMVMTAAMLVKSGRCENVLVVAGDNRLSGMSRDGAIAALSTVGHPTLERPYGISVPSAYALVAQRYMHDFGVRPEHLAAIAVQTREYARKHPDAHRKEPLTMADVAGSRVISSPLRLFDCCLISDGGAAVVVSRTDLSTRGRREIAVLGYGQGHTHEHIVAAPSLTDYGCKQSAAAALIMAGVDIEDVDIAEIYDSFTITLLAELECIGFFGRGECGPAALAGELGPDGHLPCNTHGGLLSFGHSGAAGGLFHVVEAVQQLRAEAGDRQIFDPHVAFVHGDGGILSAHCSLVLAN